MRPWIQGSAAREEDEHPYELLLTAETKKLGSMDGDGKPKGIPHPHPAPRRNSCKRIFKVCDPGREVESGVPWDGEVGCHSSWGWWVYYDLSFSMPCVSVGSPSFST